VIVLFADGARAQTAFLDFNTVDEYTNNFAVFVNGGGAPDYEESTNVGVGGSGGVQLFQSSDTTATYQTSGWNLRTNGATAIVSLLVYTDGLTSGDKTQLGFINSTTNGLNSNAGVAFESYRFIPNSATSWSLFEQSRAGNVTFNPGALGTITVQANHWYKFVVGVTNTSGPSGNLAAGAALYDYGADGLTPGANLITFSTATNHAAQDIATNVAWPALRAFEDAGVGAWDNFLVYTARSLPVFTSSLGKTSALVNSSVTFTVIADGPGAISYVWYTNNVLVPGATNYAYTPPPLPLTLTNITVVAANINGSVTNQAPVFVIAPMSPLALTGFNADLVIESNAVGPPYGAYATEFNPGEGTCYYQQGLPGTFYGLPASGVFSSVIDMTQFQFQPYTGNNALAMSGDTGVSSGTLTLVNPAIYSSIAILANSGNGTPESVGALTLRFADNSTFTTNYVASDWFFNPGFALQGVDRIDIGDGGTDGGPTDPRFYQTTIDLASLGLTNKALASLTFGEAVGVGATAVYAVSGLLIGTDAFTPATLTNARAAQVGTTSASLGGAVTATGGYVPTVTIFYGPTDAGTNTGAWANRVSLGYESGVFNQIVTGLNPGTTYFFRAQAANVAGVSWAAPSLSFKTSAGTVATITNEPAANITATTASLGATVLDTGGVPPNVTIFYGPTDGGTTAANWASSISLGLEDGFASITVPNLVSNTTYFFTAQASNSSGVSWSVPSFTFTTLATNPVSVFTSVLTFHNDNTRQGVNSNETLLTLTNVRTNSFGRLFSYPVDGFIYAQPLIAANVTIPGKGVHNVVYVATEHNSIYAFDADNNSGANANPLWKTSFLSSNVTTVPSGDTGSGDIVPEIGITSTPVIDPVTGTLYCEVKTKENGTTYVHRLHALDITTGLERTAYGSPVVIQCTNYLGTGTGDNDGQNPSHVLWNPLRLHCRPAMTLLNGMVYLSYASHGDRQPYHGWFFGYSATNLNLAPSVYNSTPNGGLGGFWDGGGGPTVDAQGNMYFQTGNGTFDGGTGLSLAADYAMSIIKLSTSNGMAMADYFAPWNAVQLSGQDEDLGSGAPVILPDAAGSALHPHLLVGGGKTAPLYVVDRDAMGRFNGATNQIVQQFNGSAGGDRDTALTFFNNTLYVYNGPIAAYTITNGLFNTTGVETPDYYNNKGGATPCISANGTKNAIMWAVANDGSDAPTDPAVLRAYNATNITQELYSSDQLPARDSATDAVKFTTPAIANGKVYVGAQYGLTVYGLAANFVDTPVITPNGGVFTNSVTVTLSDSTVGALIYYTLDGSTPTTNSTFYTAPFVLTNSGTVTASAFKNGSVPSAAVSAGFLNSSAVGSGTGLLGQYWANTTSGQFITPGFNTPPTLTRVDSTVNFNWNNVGPDPSIGLDTYVVEWTGAVEPQFDETYTFSTTTDDGVMLWVNGQLLINDWNDQAPTTESGTITLSAQQRYNIQMDYYQNGGGAVAQLFWSSPSTGPTTIIPTSQLYPVTNPPPSIVLVSPTNNQTFTAAASITLSANAAAQYNPLDHVSFYRAGVLLGSVSNEPYALTLNGLAAGAYSIKAVAVDGSGLSTTTAPISINVTGGSGLPYGLTGVAPAPAYYNMPQLFTGALPSQLSLTGVFTNTPAMAPSGSFIPYAPNVPLWSDSALKIRYVSVPNNGAPYTPSEQIGYAPTGSWTFPAGTVFVKTFELLTNQSDPTSIHRLETRLIVRDSAGAVYGVTYKWRPDNSDADLLSSSLTENIAITNTATGTGFIQHWYYPSPSDCLQCHTAPSGYVLGVNARQLNGNLTYSNGVTDNQLRTFNRVGLLYPSIDESQIPNIEALSSLTNATASFQQRARSYLDANCAQCHLPGGSGPTFDARFDTPLANQNIINTPAVKGNLGYDNVNIVTPRDVWRSSLYDRMDVVNPSIQMPPLARNLIDTNAIAVMAAWINSLPGTNALAPPTIVPNGGTFQGVVSVTIEPPDDSAKLYYTLDGSLPTTNSILYSGPFNLNANATVTANAWETGFINSVVGTAQFTVVPGDYFTPQLGFTNGVFQMSFAGTPGTTYVLQVSTNLVQWTSISTNNPGTTPFVFTDPAPSQGERFYRVLQQ
jgi:uncharacterized repeat protein (TIGR03806 family)